MLLLGVKLDLIASHVLYVICWMNIGPTTLHSGNVKEMSRQDVFKTHSAEVCNRQLMIMVVLIMY